MVTIRHFGVTDVGRVRKENEDNWTADSQMGLYVVADGMGGRLGGGVASGLIVDVLPRIIREQFSNVDDLSAPSVSKRLSDALAHLSDLLREGGEDTPGLDGMGSTVVLFLIRGVSALIGHMGDSRAYLLRRGKLTRLTTDHSLVQLLIESGDITPEEAATHQSRGQITRFVGMDGEALPEVTSLELRSRDKLLLCSDGLTGMISDKDIRDILRKRVVPERHCKQLVSVANEAGGKDNIAVVVLHVVRGEENASE
jgi:protein phosphatase